MAQKRRAATRMQQATSGGQGRTGRQARGARRRRTAGRSAAVGQEQRGRVAGGYQSRETSGARRLLAEARDVAQSVGETTIGAARGLAGGVAAGARGAAVGVAKGTRGAATGVVDKVRENPWPALLIGAGATWMIVDAARGGSEPRGRRNVRQQQGRRRDEGNFAGDALSAFAGAGRAVVGAGRSVGGRAEQFVRDNPLIAGAATLGLGVAVGLALPNSMAENELLGGARDKVVERAKEAARGTVRNVSEMARGVGRLAGR